LALKFSILRWHAELAKARIGVVMLHALLMSDWTTARLGQLTRVRQKGAGGTGSSFDNGADFRQGLAASMLARQKNLKEERGKSGILSKAAMSGVGAVNDHKCVLCLRKFISKHALRIHLTRNVKCRREVNALVPFMTDNGAMSFMIDVYINQPKALILRSDFCIQHERGGQAKRINILKRDVGRKQLAGFGAVYTNTQLGVFPPMRVPSSSASAHGSALMRSCDSSTMMGIGYDETEASVDLSKRGHLKRKRKLPVKLKENDQVEGDSRPYKKGLFEKRLAQLVRRQWFVCVWCLLSVIPRGDHMSLMSVVLDMCLGGLPASAWTHDCVDGQNELLLCAPAWRLGECSGVMFPKHGLNFQNHTSR
jgi:hypothetical protein